MNIDQLWGPSPYDRRHNLTLSGRTEIPVLGGITVSGVMRYMSGTPFTIHDTRFDPNMNGWGPDPIATGMYEGNSGANRNPIAVENAGGIRGAYGPRVPAVRHPARPSDAVERPPDARHLLRCLQRHEPRELPQPDGGHAVEQLPEPDQTLGGQRLPAAGAVRHPLGVLAEAEASEGT